MYTSSPTLLVAATVFLLSATLRPSVADYKVIYEVGKRHYLAAPNGPLYLDSGGSLYDSTSAYSERNFGADFKLTPTSGGWKLTVLRKFRGKNYYDYYPQGGLVENSKGVFWGVTMGNNGRPYYGTIYHLVQGPTHWMEKVLHMFSGPEGATPTSNVIILASGGNIFGTTYTGGQYWAGTVFELSFSAGKWNFDDIHDFSGEDGDNPYGQLLFDSNAGVLYGTTVYGGAIGDGGTAFELTQSNGVWKEAVIHDFGGDGDGAQPYAGLSEDSAGVLYGTTSYGGAAGYGTVYSLKNSGGVWTETVLYSFAGDGAYPMYAPVTIDSSTGALFGTFESGGSQGGGAVFQLNQSNGTWKETELHSFAFGDDGADPEYGVTEDQSTGMLYGTTSAYGTYSSGTVFQLTTR